MPFRPFPLSALLALVLACRPAAAPEPPRDCRAVRDSIIAAVQAPGFDTDSALAQLRARADTLRQHFVVVYSEGPLDTDLTRYRSWGAHVAHVYPEYPWLEVYMTLRQAGVVADIERVGRVMPGTLSVACGWHD